MSLLEDVLRMVSFKSDSSVINPSSPHNLMYKVPSSLRRGNERAYTPRILLIGLIGSKTPYSEDIDRINNNKVIYASRLLRRAGPVEETVQLCINAMLELASQVEKCYPKEFHRCYPEDTARIMLMDGCFILELVLSWNTRSWNRDSIIPNRSTLNNIIHDLLLLENQIPFFILEKLYELTVQRIPQDGWYSDHPPLSRSLKKLILNFICNPSNSHFKTFKIPSGPSSTETSVVEVEHILGLVHSCYQPHISVPGDFMINRYSAREIVRAGIRLKRNKNAKAYLDVCFKKHCLFSWFPNLITTIFLWLANFIYTPIFSSSTPTASTELPVSMPAPRTASTSAASTELPHESHAGSASCCWLSFMCQLCRRATLEMPQLWDQVKSQRISSIVFAATWLWATSFTSLGNGNR